MTRSRWACSSARAGKSLPWKSQSGWSLSSCHRSFLVSSGVKKAPGSPVWIITGRLYWPHSSQSGSILGSSTGTSRPVLVAVAQPQALVDLQALRPGLEARLQPLQLAIGPAGLVDPVEVDQGDRSGTGRDGLGRGPRASPSAARPSRRRGSPPSARRPRPSRPGSARRARASAWPCPRPGGCARRSTGNFAFGTVVALVDQHRLRLPVAQLHLADRLRDLCLCWRQSRSRLHQEHEQ